MIQPQERNSKIIAISQFELILNRYVNRNSIATLVSNFTSEYNDMMQMTNMSDSEWKFGLKILSWKIVSQILSKRLSEGFVEKYIIKVDEKLHTF